MATKARIAVVGTGWWATRTHIPAILSQSDAQLVAVCDSDPQKLAVIRDTFGIAHCYESHEHMLESEELDAVVIATNHGHHYPVARDALNRGLHVMIEKPMTTRAAEARELVQLAQQKARQIIVGYPGSYIANALAVRDVIQSGDIGKVQLVISQYCSNILALLKGEAFGDAQKAVIPPSKAYSQPALSGGGHGQTQLTHGIGLVFRLLDVHAVKVAAFMKTHGLPLDLVDALTVEYENDAIGNFSGIGNASSPKFHYLQIYGELGRIEMDIALKEALVFRHDRRKDPPRRFADQTVWPAEAPVRNLVDIVLGRGENGSPGDIGWRAVEVLDAAYRSARQGGNAVTVKSLYEPETTPGEPP
jgi:predicted dehydrogenase